ncbi:MAG: hypothetical protein FWF85_00355 [Clostridiales bacterium]|jgi:hypothetical protein|nr:hypothetical protein [Clostridiales bacterium]MDR2712890.1 hypothetical protein [Clostridiales bacterium]
MMTKNYSKPLCLVLVILLCLFAFSGCQREITNQLPEYAALNAIRFADLDLYDQFKGMFDKLSEENATEELFLALKQAKTDTHSHDTCHFVTMSNGDVWMFQFVPMREKTWDITGITLLSKDQAETMKILLGE